MSEPPAPRFARASQDEAQPTAGPQDLQLEHRAALAEPQARAARGERVLVATDELVDVPIADLVDQERRVRRDLAAGRLPHPYVGDEPAGAPGGTFALCRLPRQPGLPRRHGLVVRPHLLIPHTP